MHTTMLVSLFEGLHLLIDGPVVSMELRSVCPFRTAHSDEHAQLG